MFKRSVFFLIIIIAFTFINIIVKAYKYGFNSIDILKESIGGFIAAALVIILLLISSIFNKIDKKK